MWLLHWEFSDTIIIMLKTKVIFGVSPKKGKSRHSFDYLRNFVAHYYSVSLTCGVWSNFSESAWINEGAGWVRWS